MLWIPGQGVSQKKIDDLKGYFPKPNIPLGEAWFMGESRKMYHDLNRYGVVGVSDKKLSDYFDELISGMSSFSLLPDWADWYDYLFPHLIEKEDFFGSLANGLIVLSLANEEKEHPAAKFEADFAAVLAVYIMQPTFWQDGIYSPPYEGTYQEICSTPWGEPSVYDDLSISLFLCWRYLQPDTIRGWLHSVLAIEDVYWRAQILAWFLKVRPCFSGEAAKLKTLRACPIEELWPESHWWVSWSSAYPQRQEWVFISAANVEALREAIRAEFSEAVYFEWIEQMANQTNRWPELELMIERFGAAYW